MALRSRDVWWNSENNYLTRSLVGLIELYSDRTAMSSKFNALVAYSVHGVSFNGTERSRRYLSDAVYTLLEFLPVEIAELRVTD